MAKKGNDMITVVLPEGAGLMVDDQPAVNLELTRTQARSLRAALSSRLRTVHKGGAAGRPRSPRCPCGKMTIGKMQRLQREGRPHLCSVRGDKLKVRKPKAEEGAA